MSYFFFSFSNCLWHFPGKNTEVLCHSLLQWITFCQNYSLWIICFGWHYMPWFIALFSNTSSVSMKWLWFGKGVTSFSSVQFSQSYPTLWNLMDCSMPDLPLHHQLPEFTQTHVHWVSDAIQPSYPLLCPSLPALNLSQHQDLLKRVSSSHQVAKVLEFQLQHQSF